MNSLGALAKYRTRTIEILTVICFLVLWETIARIYGPKNFPPPPSVVGMCFFDLIVYGEEQWGHSLLSHAYVSFVRVFVGFLIASSFAFILGLLSGISETFYSILKPGIEFIRPIPPLAWIPFALVIFRALFASYAFIIFLGSFFPILLNTIDGVKRTSPVLVDTAKTFGAKKRHLLFKVIVPSALPEVITGMRIGFGIGWMCIVAAEMIGVMRALGLGFFVIATYELNVSYLGQNYLIPPQTIAGMIMIGLLGYWANEIFMRTEKHLFRWRVEISEKI